MVPYRQCKLPYSIKLYIRYKLQLQYFITETGM
jgi:hypothetical protein